MVPSCSQPAEPRCGEKIHAGEQMSYNANKIKQQYAALEWKQEISRGEGGALLRKMPVRSGQETCWTHDWFIWKDFWVTVGEAVTLEQKVSAVPTTTSPTVSFLFI